MITIYEQGKRLDALGFDKWQCTCGGYPNCICIEKTTTVSEALQWIREEYEIFCTVDLVSIRNRFGEHRGYKYSGVYVVKQGRANGKAITLNSVSTHPEAESALLDELLTYLEQKR